MRSWIWIAIAAVVFGGAFLWLGGDPTVKRGGPGAGAAARADREEGTPKAVSIGERQALGPAALRRATPDVAHLRDLAARQQAMREKQADAEGAATPNGGDVHADPPKPASPAGAAGGATQP